jgi:hypothetical protein
LEQEVSDSHEHKKAQKAAETADRPQKRPKDNSIGMKPAPQPTLSIIRFEFAAESVFLSARSSLRKEATAM